MTKNNIFEGSNDTSSNSLNKSENKHLLNSAYKNNSKESKIRNFLYDGLSSLVPGTGELYNTLYSNSEEDKKFE